jgi:hypothetical protein
MQDEEKAFLDNPGRVFSATHYDVLRQIQAAVGLEFFGIGCSLERASNLVIFEVNALMLIHDENAEFPYKSPACARIKQAFTAALTRRATAASGGADDKLESSPPARPDIGARALQ